MKRYTIYFNDSDVEEFLDSKANVSDFIRKLIEDFKDSKLNYSAGDLDLEIKKARLEKLRAEATIKTFQAAEIEKNVQTPSYLDQKPPKITASGKIESRALPEKNEKTFLPVDQIDPVLFLEFLRKIDDEWVLKCKFCGNSLTDLDREKVLKEYARHLKSIHEHEIKRD